MSLDFAYRTDYAKSNRSSCRACKSPIEKGALRIAALVQSRHHDGKDPLWHHVRCFFAKRKSPIATTDIEAIGELRWEDQEELKAKCAATGGGGAGASSSAASGKSNGTTPAKGKSASSTAAAVVDEFCLIYAKTGTTKCPICKEKISKASLAVVRKHGTKEKFHHLDCFADKREEVGFTGAMEGKKLPGYEALKEEDQKAVKKKLKATEKKPEAKVKAETSTNGTGTNGAPAGSAPEELIKRHMKKLYENRDKLNELSRANVDSMLEENDQEVICSQHTGGQEGLYLRLADIMTFGKLLPCKKCKGGQYYFKSGVGYECHGDFSEFAKCKDLNLEPPRKPFLLPEWAKKLPVFQDWNKTCSLYPENRAFQITQAPGSQGVGGAVAGTSGAPRKKRRGEAVREGQEGNNELRIKEKEVTVKLKGGAIVDPDSGLEEYCHVYREGKSTYYNAVMNLIDVENGRNSYYKLQLLEEDKHKRYHVFRAWGRIGTTIGGSKIDEAGDLEEAKEIFEHLYQEKCGTAFGKTYKRVPGTYVPMTIDYHDDEKIKKKVKKGPETPSKLPAPVQELVSLIFDVERMQDALVQFQINLEEMPLGKISGKQIKLAFTILGKAQEALEKARAKGPDAKPETQAVVDFTNRFFTYIPHSFGTASPPLLDNLDLIKRKTEMLEALLEIELAYEILQKDKGAAEGESPIDTHYAALNSEIEPMARDAEEFGVIETYLENTHASTHDAYDLEIKQVYRVVRFGEAERYGPFAKLHNRKLLWHGSRTTNYAGILSQGLRIAPPEAPATGYMFGKGIYFADMVSKSANYCFAGQDGDTGLLLLCEVALGDMHELVDAREGLKKAPKEKHSVKGVGQTHPDPKSKYLMAGVGGGAEEVEVPYGKPLKYMGRQSSLLYNEYIVYDVAQVHIRFLVEVEFKFKAKRRRQ